MNLKIIENKKNKLLIEIQGADHTLCNMLKEELWNDSDVKVSAYKKEHPLVSSPKIIIETSKKSPKEALLSAIKRIKSTNKKVLSLLKDV